MAGRRLGVSRTGVIGLAIALLLLWWALHDVEFGEVVARVRSVRLLPFLAAVAITPLLLLPLRAIRWRYMLRPNGATLRFGPLFHASSIGMMMNYLLPARAGELARAYAVKDLTGSPMSTALGSIAMERVADGLTVVATMVVVLAVGDFGTDRTIAGWSLAQIAALGAAVFGVALLVATWMVFWPQPVRRISSRVFGAILPESWAKRMKWFVDGVIAGFDVLGSPRRTLGVVFWSVVIWLINAAGIWLGLYAFDIHVTWTAALAVQALIVFGISLPSTPGFFGPFEAAARAGLALYGVDATRALAFSAPFHLFVYFVPFAVVGMWSISRTGLRISQLSRRKPNAAGAS